MNRIVLLAVILCGVSSGPVETPDVQITKANKQFTSDFYKTISKQKPNEDIFFSPLGVHTILSMIYPGADAGTKAALTNVLHVTEPVQTAEGYDKIINELNSVEDVTLHIANKVYLKDVYKFQEEYGTIISNKFHSDVDNTLDFGLDPSGAADAVNGWVNEKTAEKIPTLFEASDFNNDTALVLVNAIYFKGNWAAQFKKVDTRTEPFYVDGEENHIDVQMMHRKGSYQYKNDGDLEAQVLEMPFNGDDVVMTIVLPSDIDGIKKVEEKVQEHGIDKIFDGLVNHQVKVAVPKFKLENEIDLEGILTDMGLGILFNELKCNLTKMIHTDEQLYVSKAIQKTFIEVNEEGAEAAATTGVIVSVFRSARVTIYQNFYVDHPFLVILRKGNHILFYGKIIKPVSGDSNVAPVSKPNRAERSGTEREVF